MTEEEKAFKYWHDRYSYNNQSLVATLRAAFKAGAKWERYKNAKVHR